MSFEPWPVTMMTCVSACSRRASAAIASPSTPEMARSVMTTSWAAPASIAIAAALSLTDVTAKPRLER